MIEEIRRRIANIVIFLLGIGCGIIIVAETFKEVMGLFSYIDAIILFGTIIFIAIFISYHFVNIIIPIEKEVKG